MDILQLDYFLTIVEQFDAAVDQVLDILGPGFEESGIPESFVKQVVWDNYFDVQKSVDDILGMGHFLSIRG